MNNQFDEYCRLPALVSQSHASFVLFNQSFHLADVFLLRFRNAIIQEHIQNGDISKCNFFEGSLWSNFSLPKQKLLVISFKAGVGIICTHHQPGIVICDPANQFTTTDRSIESNWRSVSSQSFEHSNIRRVHVIPFMVIFELEMEIDKYHVNKNLLIKGICVFFVKLIDCKFHIQEQLRSCAFETTTN